jgi:hypothetical protein
MSININVKLRDSELIFSGGFHMFLDMAQLSALSPVIFMITSLLGFATECVKLAQLNKQKAIAPFFEDSFTVINNKSIQYTKGAAALFVISFFLSLGTLFLFIQVNASQQDTDPTPMPSIFESAAPESSPEEPYETLKSIWLDDVSPMIAQNGNFFFRGWEGYRKYKLDDRYYKHGIGMRISGTSAETRVQTKYCPNNIDRDDCTQVFLDFALRSKYESLSFSVGADSGNSNFYGTEPENGIARIMLIDLTKDDVLFDSDWRNYQYAEYDNTILLRNVEDLRIVYMTCGIPHTSLKNGLRFALVNPVLTLKND